MAKNLSIQLKDIEVKFRLRRVAQQYGTTQGRIVEQALVAELDRIEAEHKPLYPEAKDG